MSTFTGELFSLLTALLWAGSAMIFAAVTGRISSVQANVSRLILAECYLAVYLSVRSIPFALTPFQLGMLAASGVIGLSLGDSFLFRAFQEIGARVTMLLMALAPAIGALLAAAALGERLGSVSLAGMAVTLAGVALVVVERTPGGPARLTVSPRGVVLGLLAAAGQGVGLILAKIAFREGEVDGFQATFVRIAAGLALLVPAALAGGRLGRLWDPLIRRPATGGLLLLGALLGPFLGISCSLIAVANTTVGVASTIMATVPVLMLPLGRIVYRERPPWKAVLGAVVAVMGVAMLFLD
jgi:drug/metabolite transporter (DMT)-like permease